VILHTPSVRARELARTGGTETVFAAVEALFGIQASPEAGQAVIASLGSAALDAPIASALPRSHRTHGG
jgi:glutamyl-tRNA reductase